MVVTVPSPAAVRQAAIVVSLEGAAGVVAAVWYVVSGLLGTREPGMNLFGTAGWFVVMGSAVLAAGWALWTGRQWGRGLAVFAQLILLGVAWYVGVGSGQWVPGVALALVVSAVLALLFSPSALQWATGQDSPDASADNSGPDTR
ncbi:hypothetical protein MycrhN_0360 [Mycolicibacterium rhodesiae NBB3]|uniref:Integral membrane protein n=1 Tax=Mycolicibacterium rhodesiae (strain NBB3) TaxID=710685 RepID=G8RJX5_MYCRN|nr:hypothetical protein MycrhN_0360 [Mycolicibacterium rhodesiae NBB3]